MIKEIMLASALATSVPIYNFTEVYTKTSVFLNYEVEENEVYDHDYLALNLSNGVFYQVSLSNIDNSSYTEYSIDFKKTINLPYYISVSDYISYIYNSNSDRVINYGENSYLELPIEMRISNVPLSSSDNSDASLNYFLAISDYRLTSFLKVADGSSISLSDYTTSNLNFNDYNYIGYLSFNNIMYNTFEMDPVDYYIIFDFREVFLENTTYSYIDFYFNLDSIELYLEDDFGNGVSFSSTFYDFIYGGVNIYVEDLEEELDLLKERNLELVAENNELNSKHALTNIFEIVRGAFDGIINFLEIELMPNLTIGTIIFIPVVIGVIFFILKALVL